jgi:hypothetical protein
MDVFLGIISIFSKQFSALSQPIREHGLTKTPPPREARADEVIFPPETDFDDFMISLAYRNLGTA